MKITSCDAFLTPARRSDDDWALIKPFLFVRLESDSGLVGWGEAHSFIGREPATIGFIAALGERLNGWPAERIRLFSRLAGDLLAEHRSGMELHCALSAVEMALWDIAGKAQGAPVHRLLGGRCRDRIELYANIFSDQPKSVGETVARGRAALEAGFSAIKFYPLMHGRPLDEAAALTRELREMAGPNARLMVDLGAQTDPWLARRYAEQARPLDLFWLEDPTPSYDLATIAEIRQAAGMPIVIGERMFGARAFREALLARAVDIVNPDVAACGGVVETLEIAAMADAFSVRFAPHNYNSMTIGLAATAQVSALAPGFLIAEYFTPFTDIDRALAGGSLAIRDGAMVVPDGPGLGLDLDADALAKQAFAPAPRPPWPHSL